MGKKHDGFFAYRLPGEGENIVCRKGEVRSGIYDDSFIIAPFENPGNEVVSILSSSPSDLSKVNTFIDQLDDIDLKYQYPDAPTSRIEHQREVEEIIRDINNASDRKTIAARVIQEHTRIDLEYSFLNLCSAFPDAFVFLFITPKSGCWLGASPELLLKSHNNFLYTYALAGTRQANTSTQWDNKNIEEHLIVKRFIMDVFRKWDMNPVASPLSTKKAGNVEHLLTSIHSLGITKKVINSFPEFISTLSPTPALCGMPRNRSIQLIKKYERNSRAFYGGFCGPFIDFSRFDLYVNLRSIWVAKNGWSMFAGGGITCDSNPELEWEETERKSSGIINNLKIL